MEPSWGCSASVEAAIRQVLPHQRSSVSHCGACQDERSSELAPRSLDCAPQWKAKTAKYVIHRYRKQLATSDFQMEITGESEGRLPGGHQARDVIITIR